MAESSLLPGRATPSGRRTCLRFFLRRSDGSCMDFPAAVLRVLAMQLFIQYDDTGDEGVVVDRSSPAPFRLKLVHDGGRPGPGFSLGPDWSTYEQGRSSARRIEEPADLARCAVLFLDEGCAWR
jgi:hypothetical protein